MEAVPFCSLAVFDYIINHPPVPAADLVGFLGSKKPFEFSGNSRGSLLKF